MQPILRVRHFTDPACPFAYSAEPVRQRLRWTYGDQLEWQDVMVVLTRDPQEYVDRGFTTDVHAQALGRFARDEHMPIDPSERPRMAASVDACRAVVAVRLHAPEAESRILRALRARAMAGGLLDDPELIAQAAIDAGVEPDALDQWTAEPETEQALEADAALARDPSRSAVALSHKLAPNGEDGWRYTCPSYEIARIDDPAQSLSVPGFQPYAASEVAIANLAPELERRGPAESAAEVLDWAGEPLAAIEVAAIRDIGLDEAREELARIGVEAPVGLEGWWTPRERVVERPLAGVPVTGGATA